MCGALTAGNLFLIFQLLAALSLSRALLFLTTPQTINKMK
jgi:hypothetical protein